MIRPRRSLPALAAACLLLAGAVGVACGGSSPDGDAPDLAKIPTATLPAQLPEPTLIGSSTIQSSSGGSTYTIKSGDTLAGVAARFGVSIEDILAANPGIDPRSLSVGQTIRLPGQSGEPPATATAGTPAPATDTPEPAPTDTPAPGPTNTPASLGQTYIVQAGDIPETIAAKFGITTEALLAANPGVDARNLQIGQVLIIPPAPPTATPTP